MDLFDFLDVSEKRQLQLIKKLLHEGEKGATLKDLKKYLGVTSSVLTEVIQLTSEQLQELDESAFIRIFKNEKTETESLFIDTPDDFNFSKMYSIYLTSSVNYQILEVILNRGKMVIPAIANEFFLSEASIFRRIKSLNILLEEFGIQIKQGTLIGPESQIRFFFYNMILNSYSMDDLIELNPSYMIDLALDILEKNIIILFLKQEEFALIFGVASY